MKTLYWKNNSLYILDQTRLPDEVTYVECKTYPEVIYAIKTLMVRGAPAIGVAAAFAMALAEIAGEDLKKAARDITAARPTAVNLFWAVDRILKAKSMIKSISRINFLIYSPSYARP